MAAIPGIRFDITGASGSQGLLTPKSGWFAYVFPRGGYASQDSSGTQITFDSSGIAGRFAVGNWIQVSEAATIRQVAAVGGNSLTISGAAVTVTKGQRIFLIGNTEPTINGGSVTYSTPATTIRQRDDDGSDLYTNSMITSNANGLIQFYSVPAVYDILIQDGNRAIQGSLIDIPVGLAEGVSTSQASVFGASVTFGSSVVMNNTLAVSGQATFGSSTLVNADFAVIGGTVTFNGNVWLTGTAKTLGVSAAAIFGTTLTANTISTTSVYGTSDAHFRRYLTKGAGAVVTGDFSITSLGRWGSTATVVSVGAGSIDPAGYVRVKANGATFEFGPLVTFTFHDGSWGSGVIPVGPLTCVRENDYATIGCLITSSSATSITWAAGVTPSADQIYRFTWSLIGSS